ncbi:MAG: hypothetical protein DHS20C18_48050 [Saprospiraceae bacterium]|nr:MAG: hypothetical protein DHS20C18_48050 [Saprospiraceae bacterium]
MREIKESFWNAADPYQKMTDIPQKWANESAVILYQEYNYLYEGTTKSVDYSESTRKRIKLLDKSSVEYYSEFSFADRFEVTKGFSRKGGRVFAGVKVIKSNGKETEIDLEDAVDIRSDAQESLKKIAIPDLEIGDIIDYYYYIYEPFVVSEEYIFEPIIATLSGEYPIVEQKLEFQVGNDFFINFNALHGAPELSVTDNSRRKMVVYSLTDSDREKREDLRWFYARRVLPIVKFQVVYARNNRIEQGAEAFIGEKGEVKSMVSKEEVLDYFKDRIYFKKDVRNIVKYLKDKGAEIGQSKEERVKEAYYFLRHRELVSKIEPIMFYQEGYVATIPYSYGLFMDEEDFVKQFGTFLKTQDLDFDIIAAVPRTISTLDELLMRAEINLLIRVNLPKPLYLSIFGLHTEAGSIPTELEGTEAYVLEVGADYRIHSIKKEALPISAYTQNRTETLTKIQFDADMKALLVERNITHSGFNKAGPQSDLLNYYDFIDDDNSYFGSSPYVEQALLKKKDRENLRKKLVVKRAEEKEKQKERFEQSASGDMDIAIESYDSYRIEKLGRLPKEEQFKFHETFQIEGLVKRAGKNLIFEAGKLIGGQVALKEDEMERKEDLFTPYARSYQNTITITVPEGYSVAGLDKLNKKVENATGGFISTATLEAQKLTIETHKYYTHNFEKANQWPLMVEFLEAAYQFTQEKVLLKKE